MTPTNTSPDIVIAGGGPAGVLTGILLARRGYRVTLFASPRETVRVEGLGQRVVEIFKTHGLPNALAAVGPQVRRVVDWGDERGARNAEHVTERALLDRALLRDARENGIDVIAVTRLRVDTRGLRVKAEITDRNGKRRSFSARYFVEARGRSARGEKKDIRSPETTALIAELQPDDRAFTAIESFPDGWAWSVATGRRALLQVFVDSGDGLPSRAALSSYFSDLCQELPLIREVAGIRRRDTPITTRNAGPRMSGSLMRPNSLRVGDAAVAIDPLSGHGVFEALGSALAAAATVGTILNDPKQADLARRFYTERAELGFRRNARIGRDFYRLETRWPYKAFWRVRQAWPDDEPAHADDGASTVDICLRPVVEDGLIVERRVVVTAGQPRGIWKVDDIPLADLLDKIGRQPADDAMRACDRIAEEFSARPDQVRSALGWLKMSGLIP